MFLVILVDKEYKNKKYFENLKAIEKFQLVKL